MSKSPEHTWLWTAKFMYVRIVKHKCWPEELAVERVRGRSQKLWSWKCRKFLIHNHVCLCEKHQLLNPVLVMPEKLQPRQKRVPQLGGSFKNSLKNSWRKQGGEERVAFRERKPIALSVVWVAFFGCICFFPVDLPSVHRLEVGSHLLHQWAHHEMERKGRRGKVQGSRS